MRQPRQGIALVTALAILVVVGILVAGSFLTTQLELGISRNDATSVQAKYVAEAGLEKYKAAMFQYYRYVEDKLNGTGGNPDRTACYSRLAYGLDWDRNGTIEKTWNGNAIQLASGEEVTDAVSGTVIGTYDVWLLRDPATPKIYTIESKGTSNRARANIRAAVQLNNTGVLEQAIFSGSGQANKFINGGTTIRGGIYVVGDPSNSTSTVFNSNGNFSQLNDYDLTSDSRYADMVNRVSADNRTADELCATLRVEDGRVELNGSVKLGDPNNKLLGVHIGNDISQDLVVNTTLLDCTNTKGICTDDGPNTFDIDRTVAPEFPHLDDPPSANQGCTADTWRDCIQADAATSGLILHYDPTSPTISGPDGETASDMPASCVDALTASGTRTLAFGTSAIDCTIKDGTSDRYGFKYQPGNPGSLHVYGNIDFQGFNLQFNEPTEYFAKTITDDGTVLNGTIISEKDDPTATDNGTGGDIDLNDEMLTGVNGNYDYYPNHVLAFVAENDVFQGGSSVMAPIYAGGTYRVVKEIRSSDRSSPTTSAPRVREGPRTRTRRRTARMRRTSATRARTPRWSTSTPATTSRPSCATSSTPACRCTR